MADGALRIVTGETVMGTRFQTLSEAVSSGVVGAVPTNREAYSADIILVSFVEQEGQSLRLRALERSIDRLSREASQRRTETIPLTESRDVIAIVNLPVDVSVEEALLIAANDETIVYAQPNYLYIETCSASGF